MKLSIPVSIPVSWTPLSRIRLLMKGTDTEIHDHAARRGGYEENEDETPLDHPREALRMRSLGTEPSGDIWAMGVIM